MASDDLSKTQKAPSAPVIASARILVYARVDEGVQFAGRTLLFVDGKELGPVPRLAICHSKRDEKFLLFHCDREWNVEGVSAHSSLDEAKAKAESIYPGVSWVDANVSEEAAEAYLYDLWADDLCSFCGRRPDQVDHLVSTESAGICSVCVTEFYESWNKKP